MPKRTHDGLKKRCDCAQRQWSKCPHPWHFNFFYGGTEHRYSLEALSRARNVPAPMSKAEALGWRDRLRTEIRGGTFVDPAVAPPTPPPDTRLTVGDVMDRYLTEHVRVADRRAGATQTMEYHLGILRRTRIPAGQGTLLALGDKPLADLTADDVEAVRDARRTFYRDQVAQRADATRPVDKTTRNARRLQPGVKGGEVGINRLLARLRHLCTWAITRRPAIIDRHPFKQHGETIVHLASKAERYRRRRLGSGEEPALLQQAAPHLHALIIAALETGCRVGELLSLQWRDILWTDIHGTATMRSFELSAEKTKTGVDRTVPLTSRLRAVLDMRRLDADGQAFGPDAYVFGNEVGEPIASVKTAWRAACRRAGITNLHFHDLRREFASRLLESGATLAEVQACLGHANITMTSRYLGTTDAGLQRAFRQFEKASAIRTPFAQTPETAEHTPVETTTDNSQKLLTQ